MIALQFWISIDLYDQHALFVEVEWLVEAFEQPQRLQQSASPLQLAFFALHD
jgi:hypothetical protein